MNDSKYVKISVTRELHKRLKKDRDKFKKDLQLENFSISETIYEYLKELKWFQEKLTDDRKKLINQTK